MNSLTVFFKGFEKNYRRANYCQTASYVKQITVNVSLVCINCELKTSNLAVFFNIFFFSTCHGNKYGNILEETHGTCVNSISLASCTEILGLFLMEVTSGLKSFQGDLKED